jgi:hypothetical protein
MNEVVYINENSIRIVGPSEVKPTLVQLFVSCPSGAFNAVSPYALSALRQLECVDVVSKLGRRRVLEVVLRPGLGTTQEERKRIAYDIAAKLYARFLERKEE